MPKIPRFALRCIFLTAVLLLQFSCGKELPPTVIKGQVTDKKTGAPIEGARVYFGFYYLDDNENEIYASKEIKTDEEGRYYLVQNSDYAGQGWSDITKPGYIGHLFPKLIRGQENIIDASLSPKDGTLLLEVVNQTGQKDSIYVILSNPTYIQEYGVIGETIPSKFPSMLSMGEKFSQNIDFPAEEYTRIYWGFSYFPRTKYAPFYDSVYLKLKDTTTFTLSF